MPASSPGPESRPTSEPDRAGEVAVADIETLRERGAMVVKQGGKQIALFHTDKGIYACNNRCPHEGFPLSEGTLSHDCLLTCNWHNWKFDLESGETLVGGDRLRRYPVRLAEGKVWLDVSDPPAEERAAAALTSLRQSFRRHEYDRMAREIARLRKAERDPLDAVRQAIVWTHDRFEFGTTHAVAAAADWLSLRTWKAGDDPVKNLATVTEIVGHLAWDSLREPEYPFPEASVPYEPGALMAAIEAEDEAAAIGQLRGALASGQGFAELEAPLAVAALAHYADFGHSAIYVYKTGQLIARLGQEVEEPLLLALVRSLVYAFSEDLIPEFRDYGRVLADWPKDPAVGEMAPRSEDFIGLSTRAALERCLDFTADREALYRALLGAAAWNLLHFDRRIEARNDRPVQDNVGWLSFTHAITFANAVRNLCRRHPQLWPRALLQMACFLGRNTPYVDREF
ncbi:MAG: Rieske 2Fe-2S domain-containing protein, partial [Kiloniellales bacterium]